MCWRDNAVLLAKQLSSVQRLSGGRLTAGLGIGGWPADYEASGVSLTGRGARFEADLSALEASWRASGSRPTVLLAGTVPAAFARAAAPASEGWVAPLFGLPLLEAGAAAVRKTWAAADRDGQPRIATGRYFSLGAAADKVADEYVHRGQIAAELDRLENAGCDDVVLFPCSGGREQVNLLADALNR